MRPSTRDVGESRPHAEAAFRTHYGDDRMPIPFPATGGMSEDGSRQQMGGLRRETRELGGNLRSFYLSLAKAG